MNSEVLKSPSAASNCTSQVPSAPSRQMAFEMETGGHHASYIRNFAQQWSEHLSPHQIYFVVTPEFFERHRDVIDLIEDLPTDLVKIQSIKSTESNLPSGGVRRAFQTWKLFCKYASDLKVDRGLLMYSDYFQIPMLTGSPSPCPVSCIYFRPTFHYRTLKNYQPTIKQRLAAWRKRFLTQRLLKLKQIDILFSLDPIAVDFMNQHFETDAKIMRLPDSFVRYHWSQEDIDRLRSDLGIQTGRRVCLLLGILDSRKGPLQLLDAADRLPSEIQSKTCLLLVGSLTNEISSEVIAKVNHLNQNSPVQVILQNEYVSDSVVQKYYQLAHVALTTYQRHMGMSSALIRAALANIPVLSSDFGLMGELVERENLGITINTEDLSEFSRGLADAISRPSESLFDEQQALNFSARHSPRALADTLKSWVID
jgi:glycosyltransferase involved in cell wall biosynthesis